MHDSRQVPPVETGGGVRMHSQSVALRVDGNVSERDIGKKPNE